jgi:hypothetical protein
MWKTGTPHPQAETLEYADEFSAPPRVVHCAGSELRFQLQGKNTAKFWRDWLVLRIIPELKKRFPEIGDVCSIGDCGQT